MSSIQTGIFVTVGVIVFNLVIFSLIPLGIKKLSSRKK